MTKIMIIAGEASGDNHGASLVKALQKKDPTVTCYGIGSVKMQEAGCRLLLDAKEIAVVGLVEILKHYPAIRKAWHLACASLKTERPDCVVLIDYPGFNLRFAKQAKKQGIPVLYYVSPQVWAWRKKRLQTIKRYVDHMCVILPFEKAFYDAAGIPATYVGSPLLEQITPTSKEQARETLALSRHAVIIGLLPGSRKSELERLLPHLIDTAELLYTRYPHTQFVIPLANTLKEADIWPYLDGTDLPILIIKRNSTLTCSACDVLIGSSGTVTLEAAILGVPMVIFYKMNPLTYFLAKRLVKIKFIGLPNLLANRAIFPELIQHQATSEALAEAAARFIDDSTYLKSTQSALASLVQNLGTAPTSEQVAALTLSLAHTSKIALHPK